MGQLETVVKYVTGVACAVGAAVCMAASPPDFTGVWTNAGGPGIGGATNAAPPERPAGQLAVRRPTRTAGRTRPTIY